MGNFSATQSELSKVLDRDWTSERSTLLDRRFPKLLTVAWITLGITSIAVALIGAFVLHSERESTAILHHLNLISLNLQDVLSDLAGAEAAERRYILTTRPSSLEAFETSRLALGLEFDRLNTLVKDHPVERHEVERVRYLVQQELGDLQKDIASRAAAGSRAEFAEILTGRARKLTDILRQSIKGTDEEEESTLARLARERRARLGLALAAVCGALILAGCYVAIGQIVILRSRSRVKTTEAALRDTQNRFEILCERAPIGIYSTDAQGMCIYTNSRWSQVSGLSIADSMGHGWKRALHPEDRDAVFAGWRTSALHGASWEYRVLTAQGGIRWIRALGSPIYSSTGVITGYVGTTEDITEAKQAHHVLQEREALTRAVLNSLPANIAVLDSNGMIQAINDEWRNFAEANGNPPACSLGIGVNYLDVCSRAAESGSADAQKARAGILEVLAGKLHFFRMEYPCHSPTEQRWYRMAVTPLSGVVSGGAVIVHVDVTSRRLAQDAMQTALQQLQLVTDNMAAGVTRCSRDFRYVWVSRSYATWLGYRGPEDVAGRSILNVGGREFLDAIRPYIERVLAGERAELETQINYPEIGRRWIHAVCVPTKGQDEFVDGWIAVVTDVTERHEAEERLRESEERFRATFYQAAVGIAQTSIDGRWMLLNDRFCEFLGYSRDELQRKTFVEITHPDDRESALSAVRSLVSGEISAWSTEKRYIRNDGIIVWGKVFISLVRDQHKRASYFIAVVEDITERMEAQEQLRTSEERFRALVTATSDVVYRMSPDWTEMRYLKGNDFITDTETPSSAWLQKYIHTEDQPEVIAAIKRALNAKRIFELEHRVLRKDGTLAWTFSRAIPMLNSAGEIVEWFGTAKDITERKQADEKLRESEERFRTMADAAPVMIWVSGPDQGCIFFNSVWLTFTGRTIEEELGNGWAAGVHPNDLDQCLSVYAKSFTARRNFQMEYRLRRADGEYRWLLESGVPRFATSGLFEGYIGSCIDITDRKHEEELREELQRQREIVAEARGLERFRLSFEEAPVGMALIRKDGAWLRVNRTLCEMTGYTESELILCGDHITHPDDRMQEALLMSRVSSGEILAGRLDERYLHKDGHTIYVLRSIAVVEKDDAGRPIHVVAHVQDLTERKRVEQELDASRAQMIASSRLSALGMMAGCIAHEINNPLGIINASAENLVRMAESGNIQLPSMLKNCNRIAQTADRIAKIVRSLRYIAREGSADEFRETLVREIVDETLELCAERFRVHNIRLDAPAIVPAGKIRCRGAQICQILLNLLQNAFDEVVDREGERWVGLDVTLRAPWVIFSVRDTGPGISPEIRAHIMEPFFTTKPVGKGTGLGLSISRSIALEHGGSLELDNDAAQTCFLLKLPLADGTQGDS